MKMGIFRTLLLFLTKLLQMGHELITRFQEPRQSRKADMLINSSGENKYINT